MIDNNTVLVCVVVVLGLAAFVPYAYLVTSFCSQAYFESKLRYQKGFMKHFERPMGVKHGVEGK